MIDNAPMKIKIFTQAECPKCLKAKHSMNMAGIHYEEIDAGKPDGRAEMLMVINSGDLPTFTIDDVQATLEDVLALF